MKSAHFDEDNEVYISGYNFHFHRKVPYTERYLKFALAPLINDMIFKMSDSGWPKQ